MLDFLATVRAHVGESPVAALSDAQLRSHLDDELQKQVTGVSRPALQIVERGDVLARDHQDVLCGLGVDITESDEAGVFEHDITGDVPPGDPTENAVVHGG